MDAGLLWTAIGSVAAIPAAVVGVWQLRLQILEHRGRRRPAPAESAGATVQGALPVSPPLGLLPADIRGRDGLLAELRRPLRLKRPRGGTWVLAGMGGVGKSTVALAVASSARTRGWRVWWITASSPSSLTGGILEVLSQIGAPDSLIRLVREGEPTAPDRAWEFIASSRVTGYRWLLVFDNADEPSVSSDTLTSRRMLARLAGNMGRSQQAEDMYRQLLADDKRILGGEHHETLFTRHGLAWAVMLHGRPEEAEPMFRSLLDDQRRILGDDHQECLAIRHGLARSLEERHKYQFSVPTISAPCTYCRA